MAGHSKWKNIQGRKNAQDSKRAKVFQKLAKEIFVAAKAGADISTNAALRLVVDKAKAVNMPNDNIKRAIDKASGNTAGEHYDEITYEGYGPGGIAVLVHTLTDNRNRTSTNVRVAFNKNGGSLGETGSVAYMFDRKGYIVIERADLEVDEDTFMLEAIEAGADDVETSEEAFEVYTEASAFTDVKDALSEAGYAFVTAELSMIPQVSNDIPEGKKEQFERMIDALEDDDDVQEVYTNAVGY
ncbi:YebC/PmpR family DNA-binding transcriptional regulator [Listeria booriae]|uniref:YebC/PmpR family DNA-binding transcriptional regulator n=1 Tax=Listeria booriae TaxID=1552123 RepID=UPI001626776D|nr:YebC/PmpR family DNA-binding transcriptional regulator [Listeria booriae]MBC1511667.1 YebC/PmpR family DNA-binding transcriptional regulator [Listeria booriae]MBC6150430.1 YebC/PmpR family DNA-binding transcriptional regulator [Listeria booriae]MBC6304713.1 YebC/PmpR family DNA-binding transcriptional regulator [Listeria booriae]